jgi:hypothetical protein
MGWGGDFHFRDCPWCGLRYAQMYTHISQAQAQVADKQPRWWGLLTCPQCGGAVVIETNGPGEEPPQILKVVPEDDQTGEQVSQLPPDVDRYYAQAQRVLDAGVPDAAAVQLRKTLEAAAAHFEELKIKPKDTLVARIQKMIDAGLITKQFGEVLDRVRVVGNAGAHPSDEEVDEVNVRRALRFTTQVLRNLFEIPAELKESDRAEEGEDSSE